MTKMKKAIIMTSVLLLLSACSSSNEKQQAFITSKEQSKSNVSVANNPFFKEKKEGEIEHLHGVGYVRNQNAVYFATHKGLLVYQNNKWYETVSNKHDYMGFSATDDGFYSSGHPEEGSSLGNPLGLVKSFDNGQTLMNLGFYKESDFHYLTVGYKSHTIYVVNQEENKTLGQGVFYSKDDGKTWSPSQLDGLPQTAAGTIAAHPTDETMVGISTAEGVFISRDNGNTFERFTRKMDTTTFTFQEKSVVFAAVENGQPVLIKQSLDTKQEEVLSVPPLDEKDHIMYITSNPGDDKEIVIVTMKGNIFMTKNNGDSWTKLASEGEI
ncbi:F510_1955 family glycosylhydrolase [Geobacillus subterraneus]|uniref:F510_1955 family glycosylhydrolase n=1 Tax=Geobacillus subterraneus TaxID=129338 RepID=UPI001622AC0C